MTAPAPEFHFEAAARLPENVLFGTSSWTYPGWKGSVYRSDYRSDREFRAKCLAEYASFPWFRTVGIDASYYRPPTAEQLRRWAEFLPARFPWVSKVWQTLTMARFPKLSRFKERAGEWNPEFLNADLFRERVLPAYETAEAAPHKGPFVLQFTSLPLRDLPVPDFLAELDAFLDRVPSEQRYAVEVRNPEILVPEYFAVLNHHGATHVFNHWTAMPPLIEQMKRSAEAGGLESDFYVARLLTPLELPYAQAVKRYEPYERIRQPLPDMRADAVRLARRAIQRGARAFILVNNRAEGNAPGTIDAIGTAIVESGGAPPAQKETQGTD